MNWVDVIVLGVVLVSAMLAFLRGFVREVLGVGAWIGAGFFAAWASPFVRDRFEDWFGNEYGNPAALVAMFVAALVILSVVSSLIGGVVRMSMLSGLDRTLGVLFGLARGAVIIGCAYILGTWVTTTANWPPPVLEARTLPYAYDVATMAIALLPEQYRPLIHAPPPTSREARVQDLLRAAPQGRAVGKP